MPGARLAVPIKHASGRKLSLPRPLPLPFQTTSVIKQYHDPPRVYPSNIPRPPK